MNYKGYLIDLDGTMYRGDEAIDGAANFVSYLNERDLPHLFVTNNSAATQEDIAIKLRHMNIQASPDQILTSAVATAAYIHKQKGQANVHYIGEHGLEAALASRGCKFVENKADYVVMGIDRNITYAKLEQASLLIQEGAVFISTNKDPAIPKEKGLLPGNGALTAALEVASGVSPLYIGKPEKIMMEIALEELNMRADEVLMIGDNYLTDIQAGIQSSIDTLMVLTGFSNRESVVGFEQPTYIYADLNAWLEYNKSIPKR